MTKRRSMPEDDEDVELLREALKDVAPLPDSGRALLATTPPDPVPMQRIADERQVLEDSLSDHFPIELAIESGEELSFVRDGLAQQVLRKLRRGHWVVQDHIDLHGLRSDEARQLLVAFLNQCQRRGHRCVRVVHGKGLGSKNREPVLKKKLSGWLRQRDEVLAFCQARAADGGSGATLVLLKSGRLPRA
jgi:DNA-nicking Smr family endonuclease